MFLRMNKRGQSTLEYAVVIAVIVGALIAMQIYLKRGVQGKIRQSADDIGEQYNPGTTYSNFTTSSSSSSTETVNSGAQNSKTAGVSVSSSSQMQNRTGYEKVSDLANSTYGMGQL